MSKVKKVLVGAAVVGGVLAIVGLANAAPKKKKQDLSPEEVLPADELEPIPSAGPDDVIVNPPGPNGEPGGGPAIVVETTEDGDIAEGGPTAVDERLEVLAEEEGKTPEQAVSEVVKEVTQGQGVSPLAREETQPSVDPFGTVALARDMLARETMPGWKSDLQDAIAIWQRRVHLEPDGLFGLISAARMAQEVGILPLVRYWSKGITTKKQAERAYDDALGRVVDSLEAGLPDSQAHIQALLLSMQREQAQAFGKTNPGIQPTLEVAQIISDQIAASSEAQGEKDLA